MAWLFFFSSSRKSRNTQVLYGLRISAWSTYELYEFWCILGWSPFDTSRIVVLFWLRTLVKGKIKSLEILSFFFFYTHESLIFWNNTRTSDETYMKNYIFIFTKYNTRTCQKYLKFVGVLLCNNNSSSTLYSPEDLSVKYFSHIFFCILFLISLSHTLLSTILFFLLFFHIHMYRIKKKSYIISIFFLHTPHKVEILDELLRGGLDCAAR